MHFKHPGSIYKVCGPFTKNKEKIHTGNSNYIYKNKVDKACFQQDIGYGGFKDLAKITASDKFLGDKAFNIAKNLKYDGYLTGLASMVCKSFDKKTLVVMLLRL